MSVDLSLLGKTTEYPNQYSPEVLFPIARVQAREAILQSITSQTASQVEHTSQSEQKPNIETQQPLLELIQQGTDWWHVFEISWLDLDGKPQVAIGRLHIPSASPFLIESKSLKLYFNSFNFERYSQADFIQTVEHDLSQAAQAAVKLELLDADGLMVSTPQGMHLDQLSPNQTAYHPDATLLQYASSSESDPGETELIEQSYYSHLLRSNCPVTNQPDWGTVFIRYRGKKPCEKSLLAYIISYRQHNGFHEQCVEQIFADLWTVLKPEKLMVYAAYTRRGGLDINPCRVSDLSWMPTPIRLARQ